MPRREDIWSATRGYPRTVSFHEGRLWFGRGTRIYGSRVGAYDDFTPRAVAGLSLFWDTPLGPLRFNFSKALQKEDYDKEQSFDLTVSTKF